MIFDFFVFTAGIFLAFAFLAFLADYVLPRFFEEDGDYSE